MRRTLLAALTAAFLPAAALAAELVVVEASGTSQQPGQTLDDGAELSLPDGARLVLVSAEGATITLTGPFKGKPTTAGGGDKGGVVVALTTLVGSRAADTTSLGAVRAGNAPQPLPQPWLVDATVSGQACLPVQGAPVLWRPDAKSAISLTLSPGDRSWTASTPWEAGQATLALPAEVPVADGEAMLFEIGGETAAVTLHRLPASVSGEKMTTAWLMAKGCDRQAVALVGKK